MNPEIYNQPSTTNPVGQPTPPPYPNGGNTRSPLKSNKSKQKIIIAAVVVLVLFALGFALLRENNPDSQSYSFKIDNTKVPESSFEKAFDYYQKKNGENTTKDYTINVVKRLYIENSILKQEYKKEGHTEKELEEKLTKTKPLTNESEYPAELAKLLKENTIMRSALLPSMGIKRRSGEALKLSTINATSSEEAQLKVFIDQKLLFYKNEFAKTFNYEATKQQFMNDVEIAARPNIKRDVLVFRNMSYTKPIIPSTEFLNAVFSTSKNGMSKITQLSGNNGYGIIYISETSTGEYDSYQDWLNKKMNQVKLEVDFSKYSL